MVYQIAWTPKALETYLENIRYLEENWTDKEISNFVSTVENKLLILSKYPEIGSPRNNNQKNIRHTFIHKRVSLVYRIRSRKKRIELLIFWNTYRYRPG